LRGDLHLHTTASDGRLEPAEVVALAVKVGLDVIAITDHDTVDGVAPALAAAAGAFPSLTVIPGVEINTDVDTGEVHILGYFIDYTDRNLGTVLQRQRDSRWRRAEKMLARLNSLGLDIQWQRVQELAKGGSVGRPHIAAALLEKGYVQSEREAFDRYIGHGGPAYVVREKLLPTEAVRLVVAARGLPVLGHPADIGSLDRVVAELKTAGLLGMEVFYGNYGPDVISRLLRVAERHGLVATGGSDYHAFGDGQEPMIGSAELPSQYLEQLFTLADKHSS